MNPAAVLSLLQQLLPLAQQLTKTLNGIRDNHPDIWNQISADYNKAVDDLKAAQPKT